MNRLLPRLPPPSLARAQEHLSTIEKKKPKRCGAYQMHVQAVSAAKKRALDVGATGDFIAQQDVLKVAAATWRDLNADDVRIF